jgi:hypothetical protein
MKKSKKELRRDTVQSNTFHVGIELELKVPETGNHDYEGCQESAVESYKNELENCGLYQLMTYHTGHDISKSAAEFLADYIDFEKVIDDMVEQYSSNYDCDGDCGFNSGDNIRDDMESELRALTGNTSFKVVSDGSINIDEDCETDAEVCWNYFASKDTIKDNEKIMKYLNDKSSEYDNSCGLHININNYLNIDNKTEIETKYLDFLFNFVDESRRTNSYCREKGLGRRKYSMIYNQDDRLEFRFFSPTLDHVELNHYVTLAHTVYKKLAGVKCRLPRKTTNYFINKMSEKKEMTVLEALRTINELEELKSYRSILLKQGKDRNQSAMAA